MTDDPMPDDWAPGLHHRREADPEGRARSVAAELRADLCTTPGEVDALLAERRSRPAADASTITELQVVARRLARAERVAARTHERAVGEVERRLTASAGGLAVHPTTVRERAAAVQAARSELLDAERELAAHAAAVESTAAGFEEGAAAPSPVDPTHGPLHGRSAGPARPDERAGPSLKDRRSRSIGAILVGFGVGLVALGFGLVPLWVALLPVLAACAFALHYLSPSEAVEPEPDLGYREESSRLLAQVSAATDQVFAGGHQPDDDRDASRASLLSARRDRAQEELRVAERAWKELAGEGADVEDVEDVVRRFDPQHEDAHLLAGETVGVRAAQVVVHQLEQRWLALWSSLEREAPSPTDADTAVAELQAEATRPVVLVGLATGRADEVTTSMPGAPVLVFAGTAEPPGGLAQPAEIS